MSALLVMALMLLSPAHGLYAGLVNQIAGISPQVLDNGWYIDNAGSSTDENPSSYASFFKKDALYNPDANVLTEAVHILYEFPSPVNIGSLVFVSDVGESGERRCLLKTWLGTGETVDDYNDASTSIACNGGDVHSNQGTVNCEFAGATALHILWYPTMESNDDQWRLYEIYAFDKHDFADSSYTAQSNLSWNEVASGFIFGSVDFYNYSGTSMISNDSDATLVS